MVGRTVSTRRKKLLFVVNVDWFFISHRLPVAMAALRNGFDVHLAAADTGKLDQLKEQGVVVHPLSIDRSGAGVWDAVVLCWQLFGLYWQLRPDVVHLVTIKPVIFGGLVARFAPARAVVAAISGLGFVFLARGTLANIRRYLVCALYRLALGKTKLRVIFQNPDDRDSFKAIAGIPNAKVRLIRGSGVDLGRYACRPMPDGKPVVVMVARLLADKGVREFVAAAELLHSRGSTARFRLVGTADPANPASIPEAEIESWRSVGIEVVGHSSDIPGIYANAHIVTLPSYREGLPKALVEAAACGRAVVTTDVPGCRDAIVPGVTGLLVPVRDAQALADAIEGLVSDLEHCRRMGLEGRKLAEQAFDINRVVAAHLQIYEELISEAA